MVVITLTDVPQTLRGDLTKWLFEINVGVYVGQISARVRDELWNRIVENAKVGRVTMVYQTNNEQHFAYRVHNSSWKPIDFDGLTLMMRPNTETPQANKLRPGFSNAAHRRLEKRIQAAELKKSENNANGIIDDANPDEPIKNTSSDNTINTSGSYVGNEQAISNANINHIDSCIPTQGKSSTSNIDLSYMMDSLNIRDVKQDNSSQPLKNYDIFGHKSKSETHCIHSNNNDNEMHTFDAIKSKNEIPVIKIPSNHKSSYVVIDLETTGLDETEHDIIEIGALRIIDGKISERFQKLIHINADIPPFITKLTGITDEMIEDEGEELGHVLNAFITFIGDDLLVAHNIVFDIKFINTALRRLKRPQITNQQKCTFEMSKHMFPSMKSRKLSALAQKLGISGGGIHRSLPDCECVFHVYEYMLSHQQYK